MRALILSGVIALATLTGCAGMSERDQRVGSGAIIGGAAGNVISGGSAGGTLAGALLGGLIGADIDRNIQRDRSDRRYWDSRRRYEQCRQRNSRRLCDDRRY